MTQSIAATTRDRRSLATIVLREALNSLDPFCALVDEGRYWDADENARLRIRDFDVKSALACPQEAAQPLEDFLPSPAKVKRPVTVAAMRRLLSGRATGAIEAIRTVLGDSDELGWATEWIRDEAGRAGRSLTAQAALRDLTEWRRSLPWPFPPGNLDQIRRWEHPERALLLETRFEMQEPTDDGWLFHVISQAEQPTDETYRLAFQAVVATLAAGTAPAGLIVHYPRTGHAPRRLHVTEETLREGLGVASLTLQSGAVRAGLAQASLERRPGSQCHKCAISASCDPGSEWLGSAGQLRGGLPPLPD